MNVGTRARARGAPGVPRRRLVTGGWFKMYTLRMHSVPTEVSLLSFSVYESEKVYEI